MNPTANSTKLEHPYPHTPKGMLQGIPALIVLTPVNPTPLNPKPLNLPGFRLKMSQQRFQQLLVRGTGPRLELLPQVAQQLSTAGGQLGELLPFWGDQRNPKEDLARGAKRV